MRRIFTNIYTLDGLIARLLPWIASITFVLMAVGLYGGLFISPADMEQGETVRIMYVHVPAASIGLIIYTLIACWGFVFLVWRARVADMMIQTTVPIRAIYTLLALITGSL